MAEKDNLLTRLKHAWNAFTNRDPTTVYSREIGVSYGGRPDRPRFSRGNERSIITAIYNRIALDVSSVAIQHIKTHENQKYGRTVKIGLNNC